MLACAPTRHCWRCLLLRAALPALCTRQASVEFGAPNGNLRATATLPACLTAAPLHLDRHLPPSLLLHRNGRLLVAELQFSTLGGHSRDWQIFAASEWSVLAAECDLPSKKLAINPRIRNDKTASLFAL